MSAQTPEEGTPAWKNPIVVIGTIIFLVAATMTVRYVEQRFNGADVRNGVEIVQGYRAPSGRLLQDALVARHPGLPRNGIRWEGELLSSCYQYVRVRAIVTEPGGRSREYAFDVDINTVSIHPGNPNGLSVLRELGRSTTGAPGAKRSQAAGNQRATDP